MPVMAAVLFWNEKIGLSIAFFAGWDLQVALSKFPKTNLGALAQNLGSVHKHVSSVRFIFAQLCGKSDKVSGKYGGYCNNGAVHGAEGEKPTVVLQKQQQPLVWFPFKQQISALFLPQQFSSTKNTKEGILPVRI